MQTVYATHLPLELADDGDALEFAASAVSGWTERRFGVELTPLKAGSFGSSSGDVLKWDCQLGEAGALCIRLS